MTKLVTALFAATLLSACAVENDIILSDGEDMTFLRQGSLECPAGSALDGLTGSDRYPLRCGAQAQRVP